jgi:hypothetical protein
VVAGVQLCVWCVWCGEWPSNAAMATKCGT